MTSTITIHDEAERRAVEYALWTYGSNVVSAETLYEYMWEAGWELIGIDDPGWSPVCA